MTQRHIVINAMKNGNLSISAIQASTNIKRANIRRILGTGAIKGEFKRIDKGVYVLNTANGQQVAYIEAGEAEKAMPRLVAEHRKFDSIFLDVAYYSEALIGGNRGIKQYDFLKPEEFTAIISAATQLIKHDDGHIYLMLSGAPSAQWTLQHYMYAMLENGLQFIQEGKYTKFFQNGKPCTNVRGKIAAPERLMLFTKSGITRQGEIADLQLNFDVQRPSVKNSYPTQKDLGCMERLILQSTHVGEAVLDPCAGSGVYGEAAVKHGRKCHLIEKLQSAIENFIVPRFAQFI